VWTYLRRIFAGVLQRDFLPAGVGVGRDKLGHVVHLSVDHDPDIREEAVLHDLRPRDDRQLIIGRLALFLVSDAPRRQQADRHPSAQPPRGALRGVHGAQLARTS